MKVLVIIISYNFEHWMDKCLGSLRQSTYPIHTIVIDNGSLDHTVQRIRKDYPEVRLIVNSKNLGFGSANNIGMKIAIEEKYDYVFLMNQDTWIEPQTIQILVETSLAHPNYGILSPIHLTAKGDKLDSGFADYSGYKQLEELPLSPITPIPFINAAFWMIPTDVLRKVGGFCPLFYHYGEDKDFVNRLHYHHYTVGYSPKVFGNHDREYRPMTHEGFLRTEYVYHLSEYANINYNWSEALGYGVLAILKKATIALLKGKFKLSKEYACMTGQLLTRTKEVMSFRKINRLSNPQSISKS